MSAPLLVLQLLALAGPPEAGLSPVNVKVLSIAEERVKSMEPVAKFGTPRERLSLTLIVQGRVVEKATHWGHLTVSAALDEGGNDLRMDPRESGLAAARELVPIDRRQMWFFDETKRLDRIKVELPLKAAPRSSRTLARLEGSLKIAAARTAEVLSGPLSGLAGKTVEDPSLASSGATVSVTKVRGTPGDLVDLTVKDPRQAILELKAVDAAGKDISNGQMSMGTQDEKQVFLMGERALPAGARLHIKLMAERNDVDVPFRLEAIPLP
jgi:hypothetical protein